MIYLDNAATTPMDPEVIRVVEASMEKDFGNSGTVYRLGLDAKSLIEEAAERIRRCLRIPSKFRIVFTSGGSESNNLFIKGLCFPDKRAAYSGMEHPSVTAVMEFFKEFGNPSLSLHEYQNEGRLELDAMEILKNQKIRLLCLSHVNNELGCVNHPPTIVEGLKRKSPQTRLFIDGVQAVGKLEMDGNFWEGISGYSVSAHKIHGPKGIGALVVDSRLPLKPLVHGGKQQFGMRSGTLPVPLILGMARAIELAQDRARNSFSHFTQLRGRLIEGLKDLEKQMPNLKLKFNSSLEEDAHVQSPAILNFSFAPVEGEVILHHLEENEIYVGLGSACSAHSKEPSKILTGIGRTREEARCSLRISFSHNNTLEEVDEFLKAFALAYDQLYPTYHRKTAHS